jgi:3-hydroxyisobutyrate dehydrogenase-like beta-hydroxyacid dehydrogenase
MIVIVGLGNIGLAIGHRLHDREQDVLGLDLSEERRAVWHERTGRTAASSLDEVDWQRAETVFVIVRLTSQAEAVLEHLRESAAGSPLTAYVITTLEPDFARGLARFCSDDLRVIECPVSGGESGARAGELVVLLAGAVVDADHEFLRSTVAAKTVSFADYGQPTLAKLVNNVLAAYNTKALADMLAVGQELGLDVRSLYDVVVDGSGGSWMTRHFFDIVVDLLVKDVALLRDHIGELPATSLASGEQLESALAAARAMLTG